MKSPACWLELSRTYLLHNLTGVRALVGETRIMAVVKANAYGAGAAGMAQALSADGMDAFGVANVSEGVELRENGVKGTILCLAYFMEEEVDAIFGYDLTPTVFTLDAARLLSEHARTRNRCLRVWVTVDTGLGRLGVPFQAAGDFIQQVAQQAYLEIEGLFTTLTENSERDLIQAERLLDVRRQVPELSKVQLSSASSNGILSLPESYLDVVRPGIMLLGLEPSDRERMDMELVRQADLRPIVTWKTRVGYVKVMRRGEQIGYGRQASLTQGTPVATLTIGWADGYPPTMSDSGHVLIRGQRCPVMSVTANSTIVDITGIPEVVIGDEVVLLGKQANEEVTAREMAQATGRSVYRLLATVPCGVPRVWS